MSFKKTASHWLMAGAVLFSAYEYAEYKDTGHLDIPDFHFGQQGNGTDSSSGGIGHGPNTKNGYIIIERDSNTGTTKVGTFVCGGSVAVEAHGGETVDDVIRAVTDLVGPNHQTWGVAPLTAPREAAQDLNNPVDVLGKSLESGQYVRVPSGCFEDS
jgi:hypothetical protein